jgi:hypothetical protein
VKELGQKSSSWLLYALGALIGGALFRVGWEIGGRIWRML